MCTLHWRYHRGEYLRVYTWHDCSFISIWQLMIEADLVEYCCKTNSFSFCATLVIYSHPKLAYFKIKHIRKKLQKTKLFKRPIENLKVWMIPIWKMGFPWPLLFLSFKQLTVNMLIIKFCQCLDSNRGRLVS